MGGVVSWAVPASIPTRNENFNSTRPFEINMILKKSINHIFGNSISICHLVFQASFCDAKKKVGSLGREHANAKRKNVEEEGFYLLLSGRAYLSDDGLDFFFFL